MLSEFKKFLLRGNVLDLAVGVVIGGAFGAIVNSLVKDLLTPLIAAIVGKPDFSHLTLTVNNAVFTYGTFLNAVLSFVLIAAAIFFLVVKPVNAIAARLSRGEAPPDPTVKPCPECLGEIPIAARRCRHCTSELASAR